MRTELEANCCDTAVDTKPCWMLTDCGVNKIHPQLYIPVRKRGKHFGYVVIGKRTKTVLKTEKRDGGTWDGWSRLFSIHRDRPTCLEIGPLYKNTNLCPGGVRSCEAFVADLVIMFSVLPIQTFFFLPLRRRRMHRIRNHSALQRSQMDHTQC